MTELHRLPGPAHRLVPCAGLLFLLLLGSCAQLISSFMEFTEPRLDPSTRHPDFSHFRSTPLDNSIRYHWSRAPWWTNCRASDNRRISLSFDLSRHFGKEAPDRVVADLTRQGAACVQTDTQEHVCVYRQVVYCKVRGLTVASADYRYDLELFIQVRDHPLDHKRFVVDDYTRETEVTLPD